MLIETLPGYDKANLRRTRLRFLEGDGGDGGGGKPDDDSDDDDEGADDKLGDKGTDALRKERQRRRSVEAENKRLRSAEAELTKLREEGSTAAERALAEARREAAAEATSKANDRVLQAEARALAGQLQFQSPAHAVKLLDLSGVTVNDDGTFDEDAVEDLLKDLAKDHPYLVRAERDEETPADARRAGLAGRGGSGEPTDTDGRLRAGLAKHMR